MGLDRKEAFLWKTKKSRFETKWDQKTNLVAQAKQSETMVGESPTE